MRYLTNEKALVIAEEVVSKYAPLIVKDLGVDDSILEKMTVTSKIGAIPFGEFKFQHRQKDMFGFRMSYIYGSESIEVNPLMAFYYIGIGIKKNESIRRVPFFARFMVSAYKRMVLLGLAHEIRHYWQYSTGEAYRQQSMIGGRCFIPYEHRWEEVDANEYANGFVKRFL